MVICTFANFKFPCQYITLGLIGMGRQVFMQLDL